MFEKSIVSIYVDSEYFGDKSTSLQRNGMAAIPKIWDSVYVDRVPYLYLWLAHILCENNFCLVWFVLI